MVSMGIVIALKKKVHFTKLQSISNHWCNFLIDLTKGRLFKSRLKMLGMVQKKLYRDTLNKA